MFVDYGYEVSLDEENGGAGDDQTRIVALDEQFYHMPRTIFSTVLVAAASNSPASGGGRFERISFDELDEADLAAVLESYFVANDNTFELRVLCQVSSEQLANSYHYEDELYFGIEMYNKRAKCLNEIIHKEKERLAVAAQIERERLLKRKPTRPPLVRFKAATLPQQPTAIRRGKQQQLFNVYARRIDSFYVFEEACVAAIQAKVQSVCQQIVADETNTFDADELRASNQEYVPARDDIVFGRPSGDQTWYRCKVTNCSQARNIYELFFVDYGNTEVVGRGDILYPYDEEHARVLASHSAQAFKCKLYGVRAIGGEYAAAHNDLFKELTLKKTFDVRFLAFNDTESCYEVALSEAETVSSLHKRLIEARALEFAMTYDELLFSLKPPGGDIYQFHADLMRQFAESTD